MKKLLTISSCLFLVCTCMAQTAKKNTWNDNAYYKRNQPVFNAILTMHKQRWHENSGYLVRSPGDTIRPYTRAEWLRDSLSLVNRNWDNSNDPWPESFSKTEVYDPTKNYKLDSARSNKAGRSQDTKLETLPGETNYLVKDDVDHHTGRDFLFMDHHQLMVSKSEIKTRVLGYITLPDGTRVVEDGKILLTNGEKMQLKEGEIINLYDKQFDIVSIH